MVSNIRNDYHKALTKYERPKMKRERLHFCGASLFIFGRSYFVRALVFYGWSIRGVVELCCQAKLKGKKIVFQNKNTFNGYRQHIDMHCPASHSQNSIRFVLPSCCRAIGTGGAGGGPRGRGTCLH